MSRAFQCSIVTLVLAVLPLSTYGQISPPTQPPTLWSFLGIPQGIQKVNGALRNRRGNHPRLEQNPALKAIADLANLQSQVPAIKKAAEIKQAEDLKPQKIKAVKYLTKYGCGCYDLGGEVTQALVAATGDCTEDVRLATVEAIAEAAEGKCCANCGEKCCCKEPMVKRLAEMAYERGDDGCYIEPSARVRQAAARALCLCCPDRAPVIIESEESTEPAKSDPDREGPKDSEEDREGPDADGEEGENAEEGTTEDGAGDTESDAGEESIEPNSDAETKLEAKLIDETTANTPATVPVLFAVSESNVTLPAAVAPLVGNETKPVTTKRPQGILARFSNPPKDNHVKARTVPSHGSSKVHGRRKPNGESGVVVGLNAESASSQVHFVNRELALEPGTKLAVYRANGQGRVLLGRAIVAESHPGVSHVRLEKGIVSEVRNGDIVVPVKGSPIQKIARVPELLLGVTR